jgi:hypothetical protein
VGGNDAGAFTITTSNDSDFDGASVGQIEVADATQFNFEAPTGGGANAFTLTLRATDDDDLFSEVNVNINVRNKNEAPVLNGGSQITRSLAECSGCSGTLIGAALDQVTTDPEIDSFAFFISSYGDDSISTFEIDEETGQISLARQFLDFETKDTYTYQIGVRDPAGATSTTELVISVSNQPEPPTFTPGNAQIQENENAGTAVSRDGSPDQAFTISVTDDDGAGELSLEITEVIDVRTPRPQYK